ILVVVFTVAPAWRRAARPVVIGSKNFTEQVMLGELVAGLLEARGFTVDRRLNLGGTALCHEAVKAGQIDLYVEYTGTALTDMLKEPPRSDPAEVLREVQDGYAPLGLVVGAPLGFNNTYALSMRRKDAERLGIPRLSDPRAASRGGVSVSGAPAGSASVGRPASPGPPPAGGPPGRSRCPPAASPGPGQTPAGPSPAATRRPPPPPPPIPRSGRTTATTSRP